MRLFLDSFWRASWYCFYPRVIALSILPLVIMVGLSGVLSQWLWDDAVALVRDWLEASSLLSIVWRWLEGVGVSNLKTVAAPLLVVFAVTPLLAIASLLAVSWFMTPALAGLVAERRFSHLERRRGGGFWANVAWSLMSVLLALGALLLTLPMWLVPPMAVLLPSLIWGWLTYRVMVFDVLGEFATPQERQALMARHRPSLLGMGVLVGFMGGAPSVVWASGAGFVVLFVFLIPLAIWIYMLVFAFSSLWFAHFALAALAQSRAQQEQTGGVVVDVPATTTTPALHAGERLASAHDRTEDRNHP